MMHLEYVLEVLHENHCANRHLSQTAKETMVQEQNTLDNCQ